MHYHADEDWGAWLVGSAAPAFSLDDFFLINMDVSINLCTP